MAGAAVLGGGHTVHEYIEVGPVEKGMEQLARFVIKDGGRKQG